MEKNLFKFIEKRTIDTEELSSDIPSNFWRNALKKFMKNKGAVISFFIMIIIIIVMFFAPSYSPYYSVIEEKSGEANYQEMVKDISMGSYQDVERKLLPPKIPLIEKLGILDGEKNGIDAYASRDIPEDQYYIFGTDSLGRDNFVRVFRGLQISLFIGICAALLDIIIGVTIGTISGYKGGKFDLYLQRIIDIISSIPTIIILVILSLYFGTLSTTTNVYLSVIPIILSLAVTGWITMSRIVRAQVLKLKEQEYILVAKTIGGSSRKIILKHIIPNIIPHIIIVLMFTIPSAIFFEAFLSFLGIGVPAPFASLGTLVNSGQQFIQTEAYLLYIPAILLSVIMLSFNMMADGLRDALDPKMRGE